MKTYRERTLPLEPVEKGTVVKKVIDKIEEAIMNKHLKPGDRLPSEAEFTQSLQVGKTSVREAIKMLQAFGIVEVRQGSGVYLKDRIDDSGLSTMIYQLILETGTTQELFDFRMAIEPSFSVLAMERATEEDLEEIGQTIVRLEEKVKNNQQTEADDLIFHQKIFESTHNPFISRIGKTMLDLCVASVRMSMMHRPDVAIRAHKQIYKALREKNGEELIRAIHESSVWWKASLAEDYKERHR
jgi:GntR family transcriptional repressor for pyruvate dehydrogenase complex